MDVPAVLFMTVGEGETSYARNSSVQKSVVEDAWSITEKAVLELVSAVNNDRLSIADLGCSSGQNTFVVLAKIVDTVDEQYRRLDRPPPEFQLFLNDLPGNDWNYTLRSLDTFYKLCNHKDAGHCSVAGVAGSFYGRLFPTRSMNFFHSASSLHWLSQVSPLNQGSINISKESPPHVLDAYARQFKHDFSNFLRLRSIEMVAGGRMVLTFPSRMGLDNFNSGAIRLWNLVSSVLMEMVQEGLVEEDKVDSFNLPCYSPSPEEVEHEIVREGSFSLEFLKVFELDLNADNAEASSNSSEAQGISKAVQAILEPILESHFGRSTIESLFSRFPKAFDEDTRRNQFNLINITISLARKS
ncbi:unnamed protein product [Spirodela intermedia]|uniref:Uncharacterized protein n=1 Tax=Spirodela intermedia TaxID=51605 RepID=A0A7I8JFX7_SPIIN|nr:unnamed protein product [Spirodela intermedia]CAA6669054.1 unnamed protein product [Spirodela intermedia]